MRARALALAAAVAVTGCGTATTAQSHPAHPATSSAPTVPAVPPAGPQTAAGVKVTAQQFFDLFSASEFAAAYPYLSSADRKVISLGTWVAVDQGCPSRFAGVAEVIGRVTVAGSIAVVTDSMSGIMSKVGTTTDAFMYSGGAWYWQMPPDELAVFSHGSVANDVAAAKALHWCA